MRIRRSLMFLRFLCYLLSTSKYLGVLRFEQIESHFVLLSRSHLLWEVPLLCLEPHAVGSEFLIRLKLLYSLQSNSRSSLSSVATVLVVCSASASFTCDHSFGHHLSSSFWSHDAPFNHPDPLKHSKIIHLLPISSGFSMPLISFMDPWKSFPIFPLPIGNKYLLLLVSWL